jgi:hypothetical protein
VVGQGVVWRCISLTTTKRRRRVTANSESAGAGSLKPAEDGAWRPLPEVQSRVRGLASNFRLGIGNQSPKDLSSPLKGKNK